MSQAEEQNTTTAPVAETITSVAQIGHTVDNGDTIYTTNGKPVIALLGEIPAWRSLSIDAESGVDIQQLESALASLGYDDDGDMDIDNEFDAHTRVAIQNWQEGLGLDTTGEVELGDIVFIPESTTIASVLVNVGDEIADGDRVVVLNATQVQVSAAVPNELRTVVTAGLPVQIGNADAIVDRLTTTDGTDGIEILAVMIPLGTFDVEPGDDVTATFTTTLATSALIVPAEAIASLDDGSYAVRQTVDNAPGPWIFVEPIAEAEGDVAIDTTGLVEGDAVILP